MPRLELRRWRWSSIAAGALTLGLTLGQATQSSAGLVSGGGSPKSDCYSEFDVGGVDNTSSNVANKKVVTCGEGSDACDTDGLPNDVCDFKVALCPNQTDPTLSACTPHPPLTSLKIRGGKGKMKPSALPTAPADLSGTTCGSSVDIMVPLKTLRNGTKKATSVLVIVKAKSSGTPKADPDKLVLKCNPPPPPALLCSQANPQGGPDQIDMAVADTGTDLDNGWTGISHNFPTPARSGLILCLSGCDASTNPVCDATGPTGVNSINTDTFGPPLPLIAQGVPVCVINLFKDDPTAKIKVDTGEVMPDNPLAVNLTSKVHLTRPDQVCPRCKGSGAPAFGAKGTCDGGASQGQSCTIDSIINVAQAQGSPVYALSKQCPPLASQFVANGALDIKLRLTTGTSTLQGPTPCTAQPGEPHGVDVQDDNCQGTPCNATCTGSACVKMVPDPVTGNMVCQDAKGGLSQVCCAGSTTRPCYPTAGGGSITRTGRPDPPAPVWPDPTYPKTSTKGVLVSVFCEPATGAGTVNATAGLPGPGALILPGTQILRKISSP